MEIVVSPPFARLVEGKEIDDLRNRHAESTGSQAERSGGQVNDSSDESVELCGGTENGAGSCAWRAHPMAPVLPVAATTTDVS